MKTLDHPHALDALTAALGGRKVYAILWGWWLFVSMCGYYALTLPQREVGTGTGKAVMIVGILGLLVTSWQLIDGLASKRKREELLAKQTDLPEARTVFRLLVWTVPVVGLGAMLAPILIK
jgi:hypothetical protein